MNEKKNLLVGGEKILFLPSSSKEFRRINLIKKNRYLVYFDGVDYWKIDKAIGIPAMKKQIELFIAGNNKFREDNFEQEISLIPILFYNSLLEIREIPKEIKTWFCALKFYLEDNEVRELPSYSLDHTFLMIGTQRVPVLKGLGINFLLDWLNRVFLGKIKVKVCEANFCNRIYIPSRKDQRFCCESHRAMTIRKIYKEK